MTYLPPVVARLSFDLGDLSAKIDEAKAKIKSLGDTVHIKMDVNNSQLRQMAQDMEAIHRMMGANQSIRDRVNLDDADAKARLTELTRDRTTTVRVRVNKSDLSQAESLLGAVKKLFTGGPDVNLPFTSMGASPMGLAGIAAGITALLPELAGLVSGFSAAGAAAAAFYVLAHPAIKNLQADVQGLSAANQKLHVAQNAYQLDPSKTNLKALTKAQDEYNATLKAAGQDAGPAAAGMLRLREEYLKITTGFKPEAFKVLGSGIKLVADLLPKAVPFANTFADSMSKWLNNLDKASKGSAFQNFLKQFQSISGPALQAITAGIGNVAGSIGRLLTVMSGKDVAHTINIAFSAISGTIGGLTATIRFLMTAWDGMGLAIGNVKGSLHSVAQAFDNVRHGLADMGASILHAFTGIPGSIAGIASKMVAPFKSVPGQIKGVFAGAAGWLISAGQWVVSGFVKGAQQTWSAVSGFFSGIGGKVKAFFAGAAGWLVSAGEAIMSGLLAGITSAWNKVASFLSSLAGKIKSLKGPLDYDRVMLYPHGQAIMQGLMAGMGSQVPALEAQLRGITSTIAGIAGSHAAPAGAAFDQPIHVHVHLDGREITNAVAQRAVQTQRRTGTNGLTKRTR